MNRPLPDRNATEPCPQVLPGFEHVQRSWDRQHVRWSAKIMPGEYFVTRNDELVSTVLGSCISACIHDPVLRIGGMNHFMLPEDTSNGMSAWLDPSVGLATRYGSFAMERLINDLMKLGARRERLEVKLVGGGRILTSMTDVGERNIAFARNWLRLEGLRIVAEDVGESFPRRILYFPAAGRVLLHRLRSLDGRTIACREQQYLADLDATSAGGDVELFE